MKVKRNVNSLTSSSLFLLEGQIKRRSLAALSEHFLFESTVWANSFLFSGEINIQTNELWQRGCEERLAVFKTFKAD
jgi:hypothetical protein